MRSIPKEILERSQSLKEGGVLAPKEFLHLGSRAAVDQAFCRLVKAGRLMRVARGTYVAPAHRDGMPKGPSAESVAKSIAAQGKQAIAIDGARAAKALGLARRSPTQEVYLTTGRSRQLAIAGQAFALQHAPYWQLALGSRPAGDALRALAWMGHERANAAAKKLRTRLSTEEWDALISVRASLPSWLATALGKASIRESVR